MLIKTKKWLINDCSMTVYKCAIQKFLNEMQFYSVKDETFRVVRESWIKYLKDNGIIT